MIWTGETLLLDRQTERQSVNSFMIPFRFTYVVGKLALDERVVRLAEVELRLLPRRVGRHDQREPPRRLVRPRGEGVVEPELANEGRHVAEKRQDIGD